MINLPAWKLTLTEPLYDSSSRSPIEMTAQVYGKMREVVEEINKFTEEISKNLENHTINTISDIDEFKKTTTCIMQKYIESIDLKINTFESNISEMVKGVVGDSILSYSEEDEEIIVGG